MQGVLLLSLLVLQVFSVSIGDRLFRTYTKYVPMPLNVSTALPAGWKTSGKCIGGVGIPYNYQATAPSVDAPVTLYLSSQTNQVVGVGVDVYGEVEAKLLSAGYWQKVADSQYRLTVSFTSVGASCLSNSNTTGLGDRLVINANTIAHSIPTTESEATAKGWHKGSCFYSMGYHYFYDIATAPKMSWKSENLLPVVAMYSQGVINAFFFADSTIQQGVFSAHWWEPIALPNFLMCKNTCDADCTFSGTSFWSTMHIYLRDYTQATCAGGCDTACCP